MIKKMMAICLLTAVVTPALAYKITVQPNQSQQAEVSGWKFETKDDGMFFILGVYTNKLLVIHANETVANGAAADTVTVLCNEYTENNMGLHRLTPGSTLTCKGNYHDVVSMQTEPSDFKNGAQGNYEFKPVS